MGGKRQLLSGLGGYRVVGGTGLKPGSNVALSVDDDELIVQAGFKKQAYPLATVSAAAATRQEIEEQLTTSGAEAGELDWGKKTHPKWLAISIATDQDSQAILVLEHDKAEQDAAAIQERIDKWHMRANTATEAGMEGGTAPPMHRIGKTSKRGSPRTFYRVRR